MDVIKVRSRQGEVFQWLIVDLFEFIHILSLKVVRKSVNIANEISKLQGDGFC